MVYAGSPSGIGGLPVCRSITAHRIRFDPAMPSFVMIRLR